MADKVKLNARDMVIEVVPPTALAAGGTLEWVEIDGLTNFVPNPSENEEMAETTTFKDEGNFNQEKMQKGAQVEVEGFEMADRDGVPDPGQQVCLDWHELLGPESQGMLRFRNKLSKKWKVWRATCTVGEGGGETNDKAAFNATFVRCGPSEEADVDPVTTP